MDFEATVFAVLPLVTGMSATTNQEWKKQEVVFEFQQGQYSRKICVGFWNDKAASAASLKVGDHVVVSTNIESRERNGRWFTEARGWRFTTLAPGQGVPQGFGQPQAAAYGAPAPAQQYGAPAPQYGAPAEAPQYGAPAPQYGAPAEAPQYGAPAPQYGAPAPAPQYGAPAPAPQYGAPAPEAGGADDLPF